MTQAASVRIADLKPHPSNARIGNVEAIAESLRAHGQYGPIVIRPDHTILAGHHVAKAAKSIGWTHLSAVVIDCTDADALRILLADNRASDLGAYDHEALLAILRELPDLDGTGYGQADIDELDAIVNRDEPIDMPPSPAEPAQPTAVRIRCGPAIAFGVDPDAWAAWHDARIGQARKPQAIALIKAMLDLPVPHRPDPAPQPAPDTGMETIGLHHVQPHPANPRDGDIGAIAESLRALGQYRPIVVNKRTSRILKGNHTHAAAKALGWTEIAVHYIDVDEDAELRIILADNRTADLATYDPAALGRLLAAADLTGTGYDPDDVDDIMRGKRTKPGPPPTGQTGFKVGPYGWRTPTDAYRAWIACTDHDAVVDLLGLPPAACHP